MTFEEILDHAIAMLQRRGRVTYRTLKRQFQLEDDALEDLKTELIKGQRLAVDEDGDVLVWTGGANMRAASIASPPPHWERSHADQPVGADIPPAEPRTSGPERRQLTVLFCDLVDSTALAIQLDPEDLREVVRAYQATCAEVIARFEGHIAQYLGDGLLVYFGYPRAHEDDAQRAVRTGLGMVEAMGTLQPRLPQEAGGRLAVRVGIHTGLVVVGEMGGGTRQEQLALGDTPNIAARLQSLAAPNRVVISERTRQLVGATFDFETLGLHTLKGVPTPLPIYGVRGERAAESRFEAVSTAALTPLVGREEELALLLRRWAQARAGEGQAVLLTGEPGIGKSRLLQAVREQVAAEPHIRLAYQCSPYHANSAFYPVMAQLERAARFETGDPPAQKLDKLEALLGQGTTRVVEVAPLVAALWSLPTGDRYPPLSLSPERQKAQTVAALVDQVAGLSRRERVLCLVEDAHRCDPTTLDVLDQLVHRVPELRVLVLITSRPEFTAPWTASHLTTLTLARLGRAHVATMVAQLTSGKALPSEVLAQILTKTDGVPLFVEELTKSILESGLLHEVGERYALTGPLPPLAIPATVQDSLMARLDRLASVKEVAQFGAVLGREFSYALLAAVSPLGEPALVDALDQLLRAGLLFRQGQPPEAHYRFKHALVQDAAYASLLKNTRQQLHRQIATVLEARFPAVVETEPEVLARHYTEAGLPAQAIPYWQRAGERAMARSALREAVECLEQALRALQQLPESRETMAQGIDLRLTLRNALLPLGEFDRLFATLREAEALATALNDPRRSGWVHTHMTHYFWIARHLDQALVSGQRALALATPLNDFELYAAANFCLAEVYYTLGDYPQAIAALRWNVEAITGDRIHKVFGAPAIYSVVSRRWLVTALAEVGAFAEGLARGEEAIRIAEAAEHPYSLVNAYLGLSYVAVRQGDFPQAIPLLTRALELCHVWDLAQIVPICAVFLGHALALAGRSAEGLTLLQQTVPQAAPQSLIGRNTQMAIHMSGTYLSAGRLEEATVLARQALDLACEQQARGDQAYALRLLGEIAARRDPPEAEPAETHDRQALTLAEALGMRPLQAHCHQGLGTVYAKIGRPEQAQVRLSTAIDLYRAMAMSFWLPQAEAALAQVEGR